MPFGWDAQGLGGQKASANRSRRSILEHLIYSTSDIEIRIMKLYGPFLGLFALLMGCQQAPTTEIKIQGLFNGLPVTCQKPLKDKAGKGFQLRDFRFFAHDIQLTDSDGKKWPLKLKADGEWQQENVALIDLENGQGSCENGTEGMNAHLRGFTEAKYPTHITFTLGVPFDINHLDPTQADPPLDIMAMHWGWRGGYKFIRLEGLREDLIVEAHVGSINCQGEMTAITHCDYPNRAQFTIPLDNNLARFEVQDIVPLKGKCMGEKGPKCDKTLAAMGLSGGGGQEGVQ